MKTKIFSLFAAAIIAMPAISAQNNGCEIRLAVAEVTQGDKVPEGIQSRLQSKLTRIIAREGVVADNYDGQFFVTGRFDNAYSDIVGAPNVKYVINTDLTLYIGDNQNQQIFATTTIPMKGVGASEERAYMKCLENLSVENPKFRAFIKEGKEKIIQYFDNNYQSYIANAKAALTSRNYDQALYYATSIPECCKGWDEAQALIQTIYKDNTNYESSMLLAQARAAWAANPNENGAQEAMSYLSQIDPSAKCYADAQSLTKTITSTVRSDWEFENITKAKMEHELAKRRIAAARDAAVAWAKNQPKTVYKVNWVVRNTHHYHW